MGTALQCCNLQQHLAASGVRWANNNLCMRCGSRRHCSKQGAKWLRWGITAKCSLCLLAVVAVVVVAAVYRLPLPFPSPLSDWKQYAYTICTQKVNLSCAAGKRKLWQTQPSALPPFPSPLVVHLRPFYIVPALSRSEAHNLQPLALKDLCLGHRLSQSNLLASSSSCSAAGAFFVAQPNSIFAFGFQFAIAIGHAKSVNYTMQQGSKAASGFFWVQRGGEG